MKQSDFAKLLEDTDTEVIGGASKVGILGLTEVTLQLLGELARCGLTNVVQGVYVPEPVNVDQQRLSVPVYGFSEIINASLDVLVVASDEDKEDLLCGALPFIQGTPKVVVAGYGHFAFHDRLLAEEVSQLLVPSFANGYPHTLTHIYQCLCNAARLGLTGVVAEFGMFKGGTTMLISRLIERLGMSWHMIGFDTFDGFPPRRSPLDMYDHPGCVFSDLPAVRRYLEGRDVEIIAGDIVQTCSRLANEDLVLTFIDTDNYTPAKAAIEIVKERTLVGGAIVFDHFTGVDRFRYTLGERLAAKSLLDDARYLNLHATGVFFRQK